MEEDKEQKRLEQELISMARHEIDEFTVESLKEASDNLFSLLVKTYGQKCVRHWVFSHYVALDEMAPTELGLVIKDYLNASKKLSYGDRFLQKLLDESR